MLERGLDAEDQVVARYTKVEEAPVHALVNAGVFCNRSLGNGLSGDLDSGKLDLNAAELDALVVLQLTARGEEGALSEPRNDLGEGILRRGAVVVERAGVNELHRTRLVAQHDELHLLLISNSVDPTRNGSLSIACGGQVLNEGACSHGPEFTSDNERESAAGLPT